MLVPAYQQVPTAITARDKVNPVLASSFCPLQTKSFFLWQWRCKALDGYEACIGAGCCVYRAAVYARLTWQQYS